MKLALIAAVAVSALAAPAFAQTSGNVAVSGVIENFCEMSVEASTAPLVISEYAAINQKIGTMNLRCNSATGFKVVPTSANNFALASDLHTIAYGLTAVGQAGPGSPLYPVSGLGFGANANNRAATLPGGFSSDITLSAPQRTTEGLYAGTYTDVITLTISAN